MKNRLSKLKTISAQPRDHAHDIKEYEFENALGFPYVIHSENTNLKLSSWISENLNKFETSLLKYGAILFRDFGINTVEKFQDLMSIFPNDLLEYKMRSSPRHSLIKNVYVSTTYPADQSINMHSESSYAPAHPSRIVFCCITPATTGGETPIADNRLILKYLSGDTKQKFKKKGVQYRRNLNGFLGLTWQEVFQTDDKEEVMAECERSGMKYEWKDEDGLLLTWTKDAIWNHPKTNQETWFNHGLFFNKYMLDESVLSSVETDADLPNDTYFGDGTPISKSEIEEVRLAYEKATISYPWQQGDVLFLDNMLFSHGRNPYSGERQIIVSIS